MLDADASVLLSVVPGQKGKLFHLNRITKASSNSGDHFLSTNITPQDASTTAYTLHALQQPTRKMQGQRYGRIKLNRSFGFTTGKFLLITKMIICSW